MAGNTVSLLCSEWLALTLVLSFATVTKGCSGPCVCDSAHKSAVCTDAAGAALTSGLPSDTKSLAVRGSNSRSVNFSRLRKSDLDGFPNLTFLTISHTLLSSIDKYAFDGVKQLQQLDLSFNHLSQLQYGTLQGLTALQYLHLTGNEGCQLDMGAFQGLGSLLELYLGSMGLGSISSLFFQGLNSLQMLDLSDNGLTELPTDFTLPNVFQNLYDLDLAFNHLTELSNSTEPLIRRLTTVKLAGNPWHCSCTLLWLKAYSQHIYAQHGHINVICDSPDILKYQTFALIDDQHLKCTPPTIHCDTPKPVFEGETLVIKCKITGDPFPDVSWVWANGFTVTVDGKAGRGIAVNVSDTVGGEKAEITVPALLSYNGTMHVKASNVDGRDQAEVDVIVYPITTTTSTVTTTTTTTTTPAHTTTTTTTPAHTTTTTTTTTPRPTSTHSPQTTPNNLYSAQTTTASSQANDSSGVSQKFLIFVSALIASVGLLSAGIIGGLLYKYLSSLSKLKPVQMSGENVERYIQSPRREKDGKKGGNRVSPEVPVERSTPPISPRFLIELQPGHA